MSLALPSLCLSSRDLTVFILVNTGNSKPIFKCVFKAFFKNPVYVTSYLKVFKGSAIFDVCAVLR